VKREGEKEREGKKERKKNDITYRQHE